MDWFDSVVGYYYSTEGAGSTAWRMFFLVNSGQTEPAGLKKQKVVGKNRNRGRSKSHDIRFKCRRRTKKKIQWDEGESSRLLEFWRYRRTSRRHFVTSSLRHLVTSYAGLPCHRLFLFPCCRSGSSRCGGRYVLSRLSLGLRMPSARPTGCVIVRMPFN